MLKIPGYKITEQLYESSNSLIYRGEKTSGGEKIVLKMLKDAYPSPERIVGFKREYEILGKLNLPGVVKAYELLSRNDRPMLVLEDFGGTDLTKLKLAGKLELSEWLKIAIDLAEILGQIHGEGIIHKDINPSNILLEPKSRRIKIVDFGISTVRSREMPNFEHPSFIEGTLAYISPEQTGRMNRALDYRSDYYSLGVTLYQLLVGELPFESEDVLELIHSHIAKEARLPRELTGKFDVTSLETVSQIIMKLMAKNPEDRYRSADGLQADLKECLGRWEKSGKIESFSLGRADVADKLEIPQKLYGRDRELEQLLKAWERIASDRQKEMLLVGGAAGVGKSVLVRELEKVVVASGGNFISARCDRHQQIPYYGIARAFNNWCDRLLGETESTLNLWRDRIQTAVGKNGQVLIEIIPNLEKVIGKQPWVPLVELIESQNRFNCLFQKFLLVICGEKHPLALFIDDLQWGDEASRKLLRKTASNPSINNLLIIGAYRDNEVDAPGPIETESGAVSFIKLDNLTKTDVSALITETIPCPQESCRELIEVVYAQTKGNPFFIREFLRSLSKEGFLSWDSEEKKWRIALDKIKEKNTVKQKKAREKNRGICHYLLEAKTAKKRGDNWQAARAYEKAVKEAKEKGEIGDEALSYELAGEFYLESEMEEIARTYLTKARSAYHGFQNRAKVKELETKYPQIFPNKLSETELEGIYNFYQKSSQNKTNNTDTASLDLSSILKASQTLAGEIILESLLAKMMKIVIENAGAEKGYLIMEKDEGQWAIEAATNASGDVEVLQSILIEKVSGESQMPMVSNSIVNYAMRTQENVVLNDAVSRGNFTNTPYILKQKPKSVLCSPLQNQGKLVGILYLENNLVTGAFTSERIKLLNMLAASAAVAIENAKLFARSRQSEGKLTQILEALPVGVMLVEDKGKVSYLNQTGEQLLGAGKAEVTAGEFYVADSDRLYPSDRLPPARALAGENVMADDLEIHRGGEVIPIEMRSTPVIDARGNVIYTINVLADIGERKRARQVLADYNRTLEKQVAERAAALQESEQRFRNAFEMATVGMCQISPEGKFLGVNPSLCRTLGYSRSELLNLTVGAITHPADRKKDRKCHQQLLAGEIPYYHFQKRYSHKNGTIIWAEVGVSLVRARQGKPLYTIAQIQDITERKKAMEALAESEERYRRIVETSNEGIWAIDKLGKTTFANPKMAEMLGYGVREMMGKSMFDFMDAEGRKIAVNYVKNHKEEVSHKQDFKFRRKDGSTLWAIFSTTGIFDEEGEYRGALGMITDITERKEAEKKITFQALLLDRVRNAAIATDLEGRITYLNQYAQSLYQLDLETAMGKNIFSMTVPKTEQVRGREITASIQEKGYWEGEFLVQRQDGSTFYAYVINSLLKDKDGNAIGFVGVSMDISERKKAEEALRKSEERYELATRAAKVGVWEWNVETEELYLDPNIKAILGYGDEEIENKLETWVEYVWEGDREKVMQAVKEHLEGKTPEYVCEHRMTHKDGSQRWILVRGKAIRDSQGKAIALIGTDTEITDRKRAEEAILAAKEAAEAASKTKSAFLANTSHELRSPLNAIIGFAQVMLRNPDLSKEQEQHLGIIERSGEHLLALINEVLDMAKIEAGRTTLHETAFDLHCLLDDLEETFRLKANQKGLQLIFDRRPDLPRYVKSDRTKLRQVLINLLNNAIKFTTEGGVSLRAKSKRDGNSPTTTNPLNPLPNPLLTKIYLEIEDTGPGIAPEELNKIFDPFVQTAIGIEAQEGTGLGLSISKSYIELMGGNINVHSQLDRGTCFKFDLKIELVEAAETETAKTPRRIIALQPNQPRYRILIVDDKWTNRQILTQLLSPLGFQLQEASNGKEALDIQKQWQPHLIFMDLRMPAMDGYEATERIKATTEGQATVIIALTASSFDEERDLARDGGYDGFIRKPFREAEIFDTIEKHLGVDYVCEEAKNSPSEEARADRQEVLTPEFFRALPDSILANLERDITRVNLEGVYHKIEEIRGFNPDAADSLRGWVDNFEYSKILNLIQLANQKHD
jgi:PAS domain S-box-containing protein